MTRLAVPPGGYKLGMHDKRVTLGLVHRYGEACRANDHARAGVLYGWIVRALGDEPVSAESEDSGEAVVEEMTSYG